MRRIALLPDCVIALLRRNDEIAGKGRSSKVGRIRLDIGYSVLDIGYSELSL
jgi:hypothetical protein